MTDAIQVVIAVYPLYNTLDVNAPCEILSNAFFGFTKAGKSPFQIRVAAEDPDQPTPAYEQILTQAVMSYADAQADAGAGKIDVLVIPGAGPGGNGATPAMISLINEFISGPVTKHRLLLSICIGAMICAQTDAFANRTVTTHWAAIQELQQLCDSRNLNATAIRKRWVDSGVDKNNLHVITSGGISCGMDACLYYLGQKLGTQTAIDVAQMMDYNWQAPTMGLHRVRS